MEKDGLEVLSRKDVEAIYLYGLIEADEERGFGPIGLGGLEVSTLHHQGIAAVVGPSPVLGFEGMTRETLLPYLFAHQAAIEKVMGEGYTVIPVKFGTVAKDEGEARRILREGHPRFKEALERMRGRIELDVVAVWSDLQAILREIGEQEEIRQLREAITLRPHHETLEERVQIGRMVKAALERKRDEVVAELLDALKGLATNVRCHDLLDDHLILNAAFLIEKGKEEKFDRRLIEVSECYDGRIRFRCVGPLPPYSFSTVEIKRIPVEAVERARKLLGTASGATLASVKKAYRRAAQRSHPDKTRSTPERFQELKEAYQLLVEVGGGLTPSRQTGGNQSRSYGSDLIVIKVG